MKERSPQLHVTLYVTTTQKYSNLRLRWLADYKICSQHIILMSGGRYTIVKHDLKQVFCFIHPASNYASDPIQFRKCIVNPTVYSINATTRHLLSIILQFNLMAILSMQSITSIVLIISFIQNISKAIKQNSVMATLLNSFNNSINFILRINYQSYLVGQLRGITINNSNNSNGLVGLIILIIQ